MKTSELIGSALDYAVAQCAGIETTNYSGALVIRTDGDWWQPSTDWEQGGPIIEREKITIEWTGEDWMAYIWHDHEWFGPTPLIAAMRCFVASKLGDEVAA